MRGFLIVIVLGALIVGGGYGVRTYAPQYLPDDWTTDAVLRDRLRERAMEDERSAAFFAKFETLFPADHGEVMTQLVALHRRGGSREDAQRLGESYMTSFITDNRLHVAAADPAALRELAVSFAEGTRQLRQESAIICAQTFRDGRRFAVPPDQLSPETQRAFIRITLAMLDAIASGKRAPQQYAEPTEAQWLAMMQRYAALGGSETALQTIGYNSSALSPDETCAVAEHLWTAVAQAEDDFTARFVSFSMRQM
jgi:hypothetical protein